MRRLTGGKHRSPVAIGKNDVAIFAQKWHVLRRRKAGEGIRDDGKRVTMEWHANPGWIVRGGEKSSTALTIGNLSPRNHSLDKQVLLLPLLPFLPNPLWTRSLSNSIFQTKPIPTEMFQDIPGITANPWMDGFFERGNDESPKTIPKDFRSVDSPRTVSAG